MESRNTERRNEERAADKRRRAFGRRGADRGGALGLEEKAEAAGKGSHVELEAPGTPVRGEGRETQGPRWGPRGAEAGSAGPLTPTARSPPRSDWGKGGELCPGAPEPAGPRHRCREAGMSHLPRLPEPRQAGLLVRAGRRVDGPSHEKPTSRDEA